MTPDLSYDYIYIGESPIYYYTMYDRILDSEKIQSPPGWGTEPPGWGRKACTYDTTDGNLYIHKLQDCTRV